VRTTVGVVVAVAVAVGVGAGAGLPGSAAADFRFAPAGNRAGAATESKVTGAGPDASVPPTRLLATYAVPKPKTAAAVIATHVWTRGVTGSPPD